MGSDQRPPGNLVGGAFRLALPLFTPFVVFTAAFTGSPSVQASPIKPELRISTETVSLAIKVKTFSRGQKADATKEIETETKANAEAIVGDTKGTKPEAKAETKAEDKEFKAETKAEDKELKAEAKAEEKELKAEAKAEDKELKAEAKVEDKALKAEHESRGQGAQGRGKGNREGPRARAGQSERPHRRTDGGQPDPEYG